MKTDSLDQISGRYELVVVLITILAAPLCAYTILNLNNASIQNCGMLAVIAAANLFCDASALFSIRGIESLRAIEDRTLRKPDPPIRPLNWILMCIMSLITLIAVSVILKGTDNGMAFLGLSAVQTALCVAAAVLGVKARKAAGMKRPMSRFRTRRKYE
ncbi:MAG: hypothetical protein IKD66_01480 [Solobacterium sp.]|nr:hypothetical protein [Solobacterium sp.]